MMGKAPDRFYIDEHDRKLYDGIKDELFLEKTRKEQFLFAMAYGFRNKANPALGKRDDFFWTKDLRPEDEALLNAVALRVAGSVEVLSDREQVFRIAEEYAHGGIRLLHDEVTSGQHGAFYKRFEKELFEMYRSLAI